MVSVKAKFHILRRKKYIKITTSHQTFRFKAVVLAKVKSSRTVNVISIRLSNGHSHGLVDMHVSPPSCRQFLGHRIDISCNFFSEYATLLKFWHGLRLLHFILCFDIVTPHVALNLFFESDFVFAKVNIDPVIFPLHFSTEFVKRHILLKNILFYFYW